MTYCLKHHEGDAGNCNTVIATNVVHDQCDKMCEINYYCVSLMLVHVYFILKLKGIPISSYRSMHDSAIEDP